MKQSFHKLRIPDSVVVLIRGMHPHIKKKMKASLKTILSDPYSGKVLKDELAGLRSFRVSKLRIVYRVAKEKYIDIIAIGPRTHIYDETFHIIKSEKEKI
ncbi:MAG: hypothetical protein A3G70_00050 [Planctomycetes bacterium RIFCSPLOWO2_12_FULL_39_13]|nr:MAG: hypothetical protein A3G70_00050 [Planctomycetes bacterium RIFCSPLOWO2_12_FULL_39_13]